MIDGGDKPQPARPLLKAGIWWPGRGVIGVEEWVRLSELRRAVPTAQADRAEHEPTVAVCFYRALVQSGETKPVEALIEALAAEGVRALPVFVSSLKDPVSIGTLEAVFAEALPDVVMNATGFAVSAPARTASRPCSNRAARRCCRSSFPGRRGRAGKLRLKG